MSGPYVRLMQLISEHAEQAFGKPGGCPSTPPARWQP